jgi:hypothetical protein
MPARKSKPLEVEYMRTIIRQLNWHRNRTQSALDTMPTPEVSVLELILRIIIALLIVVFVMPICGAVCAVLAVVSLGYNAMCYLCSA